MNTELAPSSLGQTVQSLNKLITPKVLTDGLWSMGQSGVKTMADTFTAVVPNLLRANNEKFWGLGMKAAGIVLTAYSAISLATNLYVASKNFAGSPGYDTGTGALLKGGLDFIAAGSALGMAFGKFNAIPALLAYAGSGAFKIYEDLAVNNSELYKIPVMTQLLKFQANEGGWQVQNTPKLQPSYDVFIESDNWIRKNLLNFDDYLLRGTYKDEQKKFQESQKMASESLKNLTKI
jgi:hypothetical protein